MTIKEQGTHTKSNILSAEKRLVLMRELTSNIINVAKAEASGKRSSDEVQMIQKGINTLFRKITNTNKTEECLLMHDQAVSSGVNFQEAKIERKKERLRPWELRDIRYEAADAVGRLLDFIKVTKNN